MAEKKSNKVFLWMILGLMFVGLAGFGATGIRGTVRSLGTVGSKDVPISDYQRDLQTQLRALSAQIGSNITFAQAQSLGVDKQVLAQLVTKRVLDNEATRLGLSVGDDRVRQEVVQINSFQGLDGKFDRANYKEILRRNNMTEASFEGGIRDDLTRTILQGAIVGGVTLPAAYGNTLANYIDEARTITYAVVDPALLTNPIAEPTDADLQAYYEAHPADFTAPETKQITYAWLSPDMIRDQVQVDDQAVQDLYQQRIANFVKPERRLVERLAFPDQAAADKAKADIDAGTTDFDKLVADRGLDLSDVDMGDVDQTQLGAAGPAVFAALAGDVVGPFDTSLGPALFRMNAILAAETTTFDEAAPDLRDELAADRARRVIADQIDGINDLLAGGAKIEDLVAKTEMQQGNLDWTDATTDGIAAYDGFRTAAAAANVGDYPKIVELDDGGIFALRVDSVTPPALRPLADVRDAVVASWVTQATQAAVMAEAAQRASTITADTDFATVGLVPMNPGDLTRRSFVEGTPQTFLADVFKMTPGEVKVIDGGTDAIIVRLDSTRAPNLTDTATQAEIKQITDQGTSSVAQDIFDVFSSTLQSQTAVNINQAAVNAVHTQMQ